ncbi:MAG: cytochrome c3 family protein [Desulfovibrio sp.]|nr:cytochrome c3 family protein [Desulfovibrio sp.]
MPRYLVFCLFFFCFIIFAASPLLAGEDVPMPSSAIRMDAMHRTVYFDHLKHKKVLSACGDETPACVTCHHAGRNSGEVLRCSASGCHDNLAPTAEGERSFFRIIHEPDTRHTSCMACHRKTAERTLSGQTSLTGCRNSACHPD